LIDPDLDRVILPVGSEKIQVAVPFHIRDTHRVGSCLAEHLFAPVLLRVIPENRYLMGKNAIDRGSRDHWTIHPKIVDMVVEEASNDPAAKEALAPTFRRRGQGVPKKYLEIYEGKTYKDLINRPNVNKEGDTPGGKLARRHIKNYFSELSRNPTDVELETLAQTWSEHCIHKTFKSKIRLGKTDPDIVIDKLIAQFPEEQINLLDGLKIDEKDHWVHLRKSNTEPIIRIIAEARTEQEAEDIVKVYTKKIKSLFP